MTQLARTITLNCSESPMPGGGTISVRARRDCGHVTVSLPGGVAIEWHVKQGDDPLAGAPRLLRGYTEVQREAIAGVVADALRGG